MKDISISFVWFIILLNVTIETLRLFVWLALLSPTQHCLDLEQLGSRYIYFWWLLMTRPAGRLSFWKDTFSPLNCV